MYIQPRVLLIIQQGNGNRKRGKNPPLRATGEDRRTL